MKKDENAIITISILLKISFFIFSIKKVNNPLAYIIETKKFNFSTPSKEANIGVVIARTSSNIENLFNKTNN
jgi:hypothetical protein